MTGKSGHEENSTPQSKNMRNEKADKKAKTKKASVKPEETENKQQEALETAQNEAKENYERYLRISAEFENYKKRAAREMNDFRKFANESIFKELLGVVDNLKRAIDSAKGHDQSVDAILKGVNLTLEDILRIFEKFNVRPVEALGKPFDPAFHQAIQQQETDEHPENTVIEELQEGYLIHDRLLRPAMAIVAKPIPGSQPQADEQKKD
jgi:molecular chaperone GrpE